VIVFIERQKPLQKGWMLLKNASFRTALFVWVEFFNTITGFDIRDFELKCGLR
jgi:hypothetical protein